MTENEALEMMESLQISKDCELIKTLDFKATVIKALEDLQQYREIGTIEEFKDLKEKSVAKKVKYDEYGKEEGYPYCECGKCLIDDFVGVSYCPDCGQKLDWKDGAE